MVKTENERGEEKIYEVGYLILPSIPEDKVSGVVDSIKSIISKEGGVEIDSESPFKHDLAYEMFKTIGSSRYVVNEAYVGWVKFELDPSKALAVKAGLEKVDEVLRFLLMKAPRKTTFTFAQAEERAAALKADKMGESEVTAQDEAPKESAQAPEVVE